MKQRVFCVLWLLQFGGTDAIIRKREGFCYAFYDGYGEFFDRLCGCCAQRCAGACADDFEAEEDVFTVYTTPDDFNAVADELGKKYTFVSAQIEMVPQNYQKLESEEHVKLMEKLIEIMEDDDDVQNVWHNWEE